MPEQVKAEAPDRKVLERRLAAADKCEQKFSNRLARQPCRGSVSD